MELTDRMKEARERYYEIFHRWEMSGTLTSAEREAYGLLQDEIQLLQAEALVRLAYKSWT